MKRPSYGLLAALLFISATVLFAALADFARSPAASAAAPVSSGIAITGHVTIDSFACSGCVLRLYYQPQQGTETTTFTDSSGFYSISNYQGGGNYKLIVSYGPAGTFPACNSPNSVSFSPDNVVYSVGRGNVSTTMDFQGTCAP